MSKSALKMKIGEFGDDYGTDETVPLLPNFWHLSTAGETPMSGVDHTNADVIDEHLRQLAGQLESMHLGLEKIAELMEKQAQRSRPRTAKKKKSASLSVFKQTGQIFGQAKRVFCSSYSYYAACR